VTNQNAKSDTWSASFGIVIHPYATENRFKKYHCDTQPAIHDTNSSESDFTKK
jgi:hypothetical protein